MSREIQIGFPCPHLVVEEPVTLRPDRRSLVTRGPVGNSNSVRVLANDSAYIPASGLYSSARLSGGVGPYRVQRCQDFSGPDGDRLTVISSRGQVTVSLPVTPRIKAKDLQRRLKLGPLNDLVSVEVVDGAISFVDTNTVGPASFVRVSGDGADALGFAQKGSRGRQVYPGWSLVSRPDILPGSTARVTTARYPRFTAPVTSNATFKVTYAASPERCPRCSATYVENDYRFDAVGDVRTIVNEDLLYQTCLKAILTMRGSNAYHGGYGSTLMERVGRKQTGSVVEALRQDVISTLQQVQNIQNQQRRFQQVTDRERLYRINSVSVSPVPDDPTAYNIGVRVTNGSNQPVSLNIVFTAPGAVALAGSNGQTLGVSGLSPDQTRRFLGRG